MPIADCLLISADSHIIEPPMMLKERVPAQFRDAAPEFPALKVGDGFQTQPGGSDPTKRLDEMTTDGVSAEVLYPTHLLSVFGMDDAKCQEACFRAYNDWLAEYISVHPERLVGIGAISVYDIDQAVKELERCKKMGMKGSIIWQAPHPDLPFSSTHYDKFWAASQDLAMPVSLHILTGHGYHKDPNFGKIRTVENYRTSVNIKILEIANAVFDILFTGVLERFPRLKFVAAEWEIGWLAHWLQRLDHAFYRNRSAAHPDLNLRPTGYWKRQFYATFEDDKVGVITRNEIGLDTLMWGNDYPHHDSIWPNSPQVLDDIFTGVPEAARFAMTVGNVTKLYGLPVSE